MMRPATPAERPNGRRGKWREPSGRRPRPALEGTVNTDPRIEVGG